MDFKKIGFTLFLFFLIFLLLFTNIGLNITGPLNYENYKDELVLKTIQRKYPKVSEVYRHSFRYVTYSTYDDSYAYVFDNEGELVLKKDFSLDMFDEIKHIVKENYGYDNVDVHIGFGYNNLVFVVEEEDLFVYFDYDTKEVVYYLKGNLL